MYIITKIHIAYSPASMRHHTRTRDTTKMNEAAAAAATTPSAAAGTLYALTAYKLQMLVQIE